MGTHCLSPLWPPVCGKKMIHTAEGHTRQTDGDSPRGVRVCYVLPWAVESMTFSRNTKQSTMVRAD